MFPVEAFSNTVGKFIAIAQSLELPFLLTGGSISSAYCEPLEDPYIYHHKWLFVAEDYEGFDVKQSVQRSVAWMSLPNVDKSLIGRASYWNVHVVPRLSKPADESWLRSDEIRQQLILTTCELAHMRDSGKLPFKKQGNAYLYRAPVAD